MVFFNLELPPNQFYCKINVRTQFERVDFIVHTPFDSNQLQHFVVGSFNLVVRLFMTL